MIKSLKEAVELSLEADESEEHDCKLTLIDDGKRYKAYTVAIANRELLFYCDGAVLSYVIDSYGDKHFAVLVNVEND